MSIGAARVSIHDKVLCLVFGENTEYDSGSGAREFRRILTNSIQSLQLRLCRADGQISAVS